MRKSYIGVHVSQIPQHRLGDGFFENFVAQVVYLPILPLVKISALIFLLPLAVSKPAIRCAMYALLGISTLQIVILTLVTILQCAPVEHAWDPTVHGTCLDGGVFSLAITGVNILTDILVLTLPVAIFVDLKMNKRARNVLLGIFMLGTVYVLTGREKRPTGCIQS